MTRFSRECNGQKERGRKRLRKKWAQGKAGDPFTYTKHRLPPAKGGMFAAIDLSLPPVPYDVLSLRGFTIATIGDFMSGGER